MRVKAGRRHVYNWDGRNLSPNGEHAAAGIPREISFDSDVFITGLLVQDPSTTVTIAGRPARRQPSGAFRLNAVSPGSQHVLIHAGGFDLFNGNIQVGFGGETRCGFLLGSGAWVPDCKHTP